MKLCISVCIYRRSPRGAVSSPVSDGNSSLWSRLRLGEGGAPPCEAPLYCPPLSHMDPHKNVPTLPSVWGGFHTSPSAVDECKITPFVIKHANVPICQHVVIKDLCTHAGISGFNSCDKQTDQQNALSGESGYLRGQMEQVVTSSIHSIALFLFCLLHHVSRLFSR